MLALLVACAPAVQSPAGGAPRPAEIIVLSTLHQLHAQVAGYGFEDLARTVERLAPDVLAVELTPADLAERREQRTKQEYPRSIYPLLGRHSYTVVALEPAEPLYSELVRANTEAAQAFGERTPGEARAFAVYSRALYEYLLGYWDSPAAVNSAATDALFAVKHRFQDAVMPAEQAAVWQAWNEHFLERILAAARAHPGERIVVLVGAEHGYWLRDRLRTRDDVRLLDAEALLSGRSAPLKGAVKGAGRRRTASTVQH